MVSRASAAPLLWVVAAFYCFLSVAFSLLNLKVAKFLPSSHLILAVRVLLTRVLRVTVPSLLNTPWMNHTRDSRHEPTPPPPHTHAHINTPHTSHTHTRPM